MSEPTLIELQQELARLRLDLKVGKLKDTSRIKKLKNKIVKLKVKL